MAFFYSTFQRKMEEVEALMSKNADPSKPYEYKYQARDILEALLKEPAIQETTDIAVAAQAIVENLLGVNHFETEEITESGKHYQESLRLLSRLPRSEQARFINLIQDLLNALGILSCNLGETDRGLDYFNRSKAIYEAVAQQAVDTFSYSFQDFLRGKSAFRYIIDGGLDQRKTEQNYTMCLFYLAQAYSKTEHKELAAHYCAETMKRQVESGDFEVKDWAVNCINMAEYYQEKDFLNAALYVLDSGLSIVPAGSKKKLRSTMHMQIGRCYRAFLEFGMKLCLDQAEIPECVFAREIEFQNVSATYHNLRPPLTIEEAKEVFRMANTHFKEALDYFVLDGYVTEHIEMKRDVSALYKVLCYFDPNKARILAMCQRRVEILEGFTKELNRQAYSTLWQYLMNELATVYIDIFDIKLEILESKKSIKPQGYKEANLYALTSIEKQVELLELIEKIELNDDTATDIIQSTLNLKFGIAKTYSRMESKDVDEKVEYMKHSFAWYQRIYDYLKKLRDGKYMHVVTDYNEQLRICEEMVGLLPIRISQVNACRDT